jgi:hypothetical protein
MPTSVPKPTRSVPQVSIADDIIAIEDAASLVAAQFHGHALRNYGLTNLWKFPVIIVDPLLSSIPFGIVGGVTVVILGRKTELSARSGRQAV